MASNELMAWQRRRAEILRREPLRHGERLVYFRNHEAARAWLAREVGHNNLRRIGPVEQMPGQFVVVRVMKEAPRAHARTWVIIAMVLATLAGLALLALALYPLRWYLLAAIGVLMVYGACRRMAGRSVLVTVTQTVRVKR